MSSEQNPIITLLASTDADTGFLLKNPESLKMMTPADFSDYANGVMRPLVDKNSEVSLAEIRPINAQAVQQLLQDFSEENKPGAIILRHGEQWSSDETVRNLNADDPLKKIRMMQAKHNESDPISLRSAIEFCGTLLTFCYIQAQTGVTFSVEHSRNQRAAQPAIALAKFLQCGAINKERWDCINYSNDDTLIAEKLPAKHKGKLPWDKDLVDAVVGKEGTYEGILGDMEGFLKETSDTIPIIITHTQQINALCQQINTLSESKVLPVDERLDYYGLLPCKTKKPTFMTDGLYVKNESLEDTIKQVPRPFFQKSSSSEAGSPNTPSTKPTPSR